MHVRYSYLPQQFAEIDDLLMKVKSLVQSGDFTLGEPLFRFEERFAKLIGVEYAVGVGSGTDAIKLSLKALGIGPGDEVITAANTFIATVGAIHETGATPVLVDCDDTFCLNPHHIEAAITAKTRAIVPVHYTGNMANMPFIMDVARRHDVDVVEDACQAILADLGGQRAGAWGRVAAFSLHPLKNLNVWGDGGVVVTNDDSVAKRLRLIRNHGLANRDEVVVLGCNSRLDTLQAVVGNWLIGDADSITTKRIKHAEFYDQALGSVPGISIPPRPDDMKSVYHLYMVFAERRDALLRYCQRRGVETKVHYPVPLYQQPGLRHLGYSPGHFPTADRHSKTTITLPCDQHLSLDQLQYVVDCVSEFYSS